MSQIESPVIGSVLLGLPSQGSSTLPVFKVKSKPLLGQLATETETLLVAVALAGTEALILVGPHWLIGAASAPIFTGG